MEFYRQCTNHRRKHLQSPQPTAALEDKGLIVTDPTHIRTKSGEKRNGSLLYTIRPIQEALDLFYARQMARVDEDVAKQRAAAKLAKLAPVSPREPLCGALESAASPSPTTGSLDEIEAVSDEERGTIGEAG